MISLLVKLSNAIFISRAHVPKHKLTFPSGEGISLVHNQHGGLISGECYTHIWVDASPWGIDDSGDNFSGKYQKDKEQILKAIYYNTIKISLQGNVPPDSVTLFI